MNLVEYPDSEMMMLDLANRLAGEMSSFLDHEDHITMAVPGGTTPGPIFDDLCDADVDWSRVRVLLTDERWVPEDHERSNTRLLRERLLIERASAAEYIPLYRNGGLDDEVVSTVAADVAKALPLSILLLGMGADMHTASLFPGASNLEMALAGNAPPVMAIQAPGAAEPRVTLTAPVLTGAITTHVVIVGDEKRAAVEKARKLSALDAPISIVLKNATIHWAP